MTAACFGNNIFNDDGIQDCLSNLLSSQIRRYVIDLYWDTTNRRFGLCPVEIPNLSSNASQVATSEGSIVAATSLASGDIEGRQVTSSVTSNATIASGQVTSTTNAPTATYSIIATNGDSQMFQLGPYRCSNTLTLASITSIFSSYLTNTANTLEAKILLWTLNLHVASTWEAPNSPRDSLSPSQLPATGEYVGSHLDSVSNLLYTPGTLLSDRSNLNSSWFRRGNPNDLPLTSYFHTLAKTNGDVETDDGWPSENYIQVAKGKRLLVGFGDFDPGLANYNTTTDSERIYPSNYLSSPQQVSWLSNGELSQGCFYNANEYTVGEVNNSWAVTAINSTNPPNLSYAADNLTTCGISQILNTTINSITADTVPDPYQDFGNQAIFSWTYGEPQNDSSAGPNTKSKFRCALMVSNDTYRGHWRVEYCSNKYRAICREANSPYQWRISGFTVPYDRGDSACMGNSSFDVPRTGLENSYLYNKILHDAQDDPSLLNGVWINFNSLAVENCWITTGVNGSCPYYQTSDATHSRQILIPTIAALIVLILTVLTILVKCSANARDSRKRRRGEGGWDYEGVPS